MCVCVKIKKPYWTRNRLCRSLQNSEFVKDFAVTVTNQKKLLSGTAFKIRKKSLFKQNSLFVSFETGIRFIKIPFTIASFVATNCFMYKNSILLFGYSFESNASVSNVLILLFIFAEKRPTTHTHSTLVSSTIFQLAPNSFVYCLRFMTSIFFLLKAR